MSETPKQHSQSDVPLPSTLAEEKKQLTAYIETTEYTSAILRDPDELMLAWFLIAKKPPHKLHLRALAVAVEEFKKLPERSRAEIIDCMNRLFVEFTNRLKGFSS